MRVLVDTSVWIEYFRGSGRLASVDTLIEENLVVTNDLVLAELVPSLQLNRQRRLIELLEGIERYPILIQWEEIIQMQIICMGQGINGIGIPDLIIAQNAIQNHLSLLTHDRHFALISEHLPLSLY